MSAVASANVEVVRMLLAHPGLDLNQRNQWGQTALTCAADLYERSLHEPADEHDSWHFWHTRQLLKPNSSHKYKEIVQLLLSASGISNHISYIPNNECRLGNEYLTIKTYDSDATQYICGFDLLKAITTGDDEQVRMFLSQSTIDVNFTVTLQSLWEHVCGTLNLPTGDLRYDRTLLENFKTISHDASLSTFTEAWDDACRIAFHRHPMLTYSIPRMKRGPLKDVVEELNRYKRWLGDTPLIRAHELGRTWIVHALLDHPRIHPNQGWMITQDPLVEPDPWVDSLPSIMTLLTKAILDGDEDLARRLLAHPRIDLHVPFYVIGGDGDSGPLRELRPRTYLEVAAHSGNEMMIGLLRSVFPATEEPEPVPSPKPSIRKENRRLFRSMMKALEHGEIPTVEKAVAILPWKYLTAKGGYKESHVQRMIWKLATLPHSELLRRMLTQFPQCLNERDKDDYSPLELAAKNDQPDTVAYLLSFPAIEHKTEIRITHGDITGKTRYTWFEWPPKKKKNPLDKKSTYIVMKPHSFEVMPYCGYLMEKHLVKRNELKTLTELCMASRTKDGVMLPQLPSDVERFVIARFLIPEIPERTEERVERERKDTAELFLLSGCGDPDEFFRLMNYERHYTVNGVRRVPAVRRHVREVVMDEEDANEEEAEPLLIMEEEEEPAAVATHENDEVPVVRWKRDDDVAVPPPLRDTLRRTVQKGAIEHDDETVEYVDLITQHGIEYCHVLETDIVYLILDVHMNHNTVEQIIADRVGTFAHGAIQFDSAHAVDWSKVEEEYVVPLPPLPGRNVVQLLP
jgi:hypothetical protein